jgi:hypothetical protein
MPAPYVQTFVGLANFAAAQATNLAAFQADNPGIANPQAAADSSCTLGPDGVTYTLTSDFVPGPNVPGA